MQIYYFNLHFIMVENTVDQNIIGAPKLVNDYGLFSIAPCKVFAFNYRCIIYGMISLLLSLISLSIVIAIPTIAIVVALSRS